MEKSGAFVLGTKLHLNLVLYCVISEELLIFSFLIYTVRDNWNTTSNKKEWSIDKWSNMDESQINHAECKMADKKSIHRLVLFIQNSRKCTLVYSIRKQTSGCLGTMNWKRVEGGLQRAQGNFWRWWFHRCIHISKPITLHTLNKCSLLYVSSSISLSEWG